MKATEEGNTKFLLAKLCIVQAKSKITTFSREAANEKEALIDEEGNLKVKASDVHDTRGKGQGQI